MEGESRPTEMAKKDILREFKGKGDISFRGSCRAKTGEPPGTNPPEQGVRRVRPGSLRLNLEEKWSCTDVIEVHHLIWTPEKKDRVYSEGYTGSI